MLFIPILLALDATVGGTLMMGAEPIGANVTVYNSGVSMATSAGADGKYSLSMLPAGTYDIKLERTMNGRKKTLIYKGLTVGDGSHTVDLFWPSVESADARTALVRQHFDAGKAAFSAGRYADAASHYMDAIREDSGQHAVWSGLAVSQAMAGNFDAAERSYAMARAWGAGSSTTSNMAYAYHRAGRYEDAGAKYEEAARVDGSKAAGYLANAGAAYLAGRSNAKAEAAYKAAAAVTGAPATSWYFWGVCAQNNNNTADALTALRGYLQAEPNGRYAADARQRIAALGG
jgi:tetratricopeptide (TPR) repeat protein